MELIKKLSTKKSKNGNSVQSWGLFWCNYCNRLIEKHLSHGRNQKSCGCMQSEFKKNNKNGKYKGKQYRQRTKEEKEMRSCLVCEIPFKTIKETRICPECKKTDKQRTWKDNSKTPLPDVGFILLEQKVSKLIKNID